MARTGRPRHTIWTEFTVVNEHDRRQLKDVRCNHCGLVLHKVQPGRNLMHHVLKGCSAMPAEKRREWERVHGASKRQRLIREQQNEARVAQATWIADAERAEEVANAQRAHSGAERAVDEMERENGAAERVERGGQQDRSDEAEIGETVEPPVNEETLEIWDEIAMMFYLANWSFSSIELPSTRKVLSRLYPGVPLPNRHHLADLLLVRAYKRVLEFVIRKVSSKRYAAISMDGWSNSRRQSMINVTLLIPGMPAILWATKCTGDAVKTGEFIANFVVVEIDDIETRCENLEVVSLSTDNAKNMKSAWRILEAGRSGFFCTGCSAHTLNLLVKDIAELPFVSDIFRQANALAVFVRSHTNTNERLTLDHVAHPDNSQRGLAVSIATRWYSHRNCVQNVLDNEDAIRRIMADDGLLKSYDKKKVAATKAIVDSDTFWIQGGLVLRLLDPIIQCIGHFEKDGCSLSVVFEQFIRLKNLAIYNHKTPGIPRIVQQQFRRRIRARWRFIHKSSMKLAYLLDHTKSTTVFSEDDIVSLVQQLVLLAEKLNYSDLELDQIQQQLSSFMSEKSKWSPAKKAVFYKMPPMEWWTWVGIINYPLVSLIAERVFTIPTSSASAERAWSIHGYICSKRRGSLGNEKAHMLASIYSNHHDRSTSIEHQAVFGDQENLWGNKCDPLRDADMDNDSDNEYADDSDDDSSVCSVEDTAEEADEDPPEVQQVLEASHSSTFNFVSVTGVVMTSSSVRVGVAGTAVVRSGGGYAEVGEAPMVGGEAVADEVDDEASEVAS